MHIEELFRSIDVGILQRFIDEAQEEHLHLDFKLVKNASLRSDDDKRNLARALSGFANSSGGIVVWGIDARKGADDVDCARALIPIDPIAGFVSRLQELTGSYVQPLVEGVEHRAVMVSDTAGLAVSYIPESMSGPHMAKAGDDRYYKRSGDSFYRMEHFDIADMFGRRRRPELSLVYVLRENGGITSGGVTRHNVKITCSILNEGRGSALAPYISVHVQEPYHADAYRINGNFAEGLPRIATVAVGHTAYGGTTSVVIHPDTRLDVFAIKVEVPDVGPDPADVVINYALSAQDTRLERAMIKIPGPEIGKFAREISP